MEMSEKVNNATLEDIKAVNEKLGFAIPSQYENFLLTHGGGQPMNNFYRQYKDGKPLWEFPINNFFGLDNSTSDLFSIYCRYSKLISENLLPIGDDGIGNFICIDKKTSKIYICFHNDTFGEDSYRTQFLTDSFEELLSGLGED